MDTVDYRDLFKDCHALVGKNSSGADFSSLSEALASPLAQNEKGLRIGLLPGVYREKVTIDLPAIELVGPPLDSNGRPQASIVWDDCAGKSGNDGSPLGTFRSQSLAILAPDFKASKLHFVNDWDYTANEVLPMDHPQKMNGSQAVAVKLDEAADRSVFLNCHFSGNQDTLYANAGRHFFKNCLIQGHVDFIFGAAQVLFESCELSCLARPHIHAAENIHGYVCAPSTKPGKSAGFIFLDCAVTKGKPQPPAGSFALGRPWHPSHSPDTSNCALFYNCHLDDHIRTQPWTSMNSRPGGVVTTYQPEDANLYEYGSHGPGSVRVSSPQRRFLEKALDYQELCTMVFEDWRPDAL